MFMTCTDIICRERVKEKYYVFWSECGTAVAISFRDLRDQVAAKCPENTSSTIMCSPIRLQLSNHNDENDCETHAILRTNGC